MTTPEQTPLNVEKAERQPPSPGGGTGGDVPRTANLEEKSQVEEMKEKMKKPVIAASLAALLMLNALMFFVGATTTHECPVRPIIPIYLIVAGLLGIVTKITPILNRNKKIAWIDWVLVVLGIVELIWTILGSYWIYSIYAPSYNHNDGPKYCNKTAYLLAFWLLTIYYIMLGLAILIPCCIVCGVVCLAVLAARQ